MDCEGWFSLNRVAREVVPIWQYLGGVSYRFLGQSTSSSASSVWRAVSREFEKLPHCFDITRKYCERYSQILLVDGKYIKVGKHDRKIPVLYGIDYLTHDIPGYRLVPSESYTACLKFFASLKLAGYTPCAVVCDDNENIRLAADKVFPGVVIQLCQRHYLENVRKILDTKNDPKYRVFVAALKRILSKRRSPGELRTLAGRMVTAFRGDQDILYVLADLERRANLLFGYMNFSNTPTTNNLIECFNSHLEGRLKTIKGFQSFRSADNWLNGYFIKRRLTPFRDCGGKFKGLNSHCSLEITLRNKTNLSRLKNIIKRPF